MRTMARSIGRLAPVLVAGLVLVPAGLRAQNRGVQIEAPRADENARQIEVKILGMSCPFCAYGVEQKLKRLAGVSELDVALKTGVATLTLEEGADVPNEQLIKMVKQAGFEAAAIVRNFESEHEDWNPEQLSGTGSATGTSG